MKTSHEIGQRWLADERRRGEAALTDAMKVGARYGPPGGIG